MPPNSKLEATTRTGTIVVQSGKGLNRSYTWEGSTRSVGLWPRSEGWKGSQDLYYPGPGYHWEKTPDGIRRCSVGEGWLYFTTVEEAVQWIKRQDRWLPTVYRDDGLMVGYGKSPQRYQLNVDVSQIFIGGKKPTTLPGSDNQAIKTSWDKAPEQ